MAKKKIKKPRTTKADRLRAHEIVAETLGVGFELDYGCFPKNVGVKGDVGLYGDTLLISSDLEDPIRFLVDEAEFLDGVADKLFTEIYPVTKVLFELTSRPITETK